MISLYKDPEGKKVFSMTAPSDHNDDYVRSSTSGDVENLRLRVLELEMRLSQVCVCNGRKLYTEVKTHKINVHTHTHTHKYAHSTHIHVHRNVIPYCSHTTTTATRT